MIANVNHMDGMTEEVVLEYHLKSVEIFQQGSAGEGVNVGFFILRISVEWTEIAQKRD